MKLQLFTTENMGVPALSLQLNFRTVLGNKLCDAQKSLELIESTLAKLGLEEDEIIGYGSRVLVSYKEGHGTAEGRVWEIKSSGTIVVNRDGYKSVMNFEPNCVKNLSVGTYGRLERKHWLLQQEIKALQMALQDSALPNILIELKDNIVHVVDFFNYDNCQIVDFVHASTLKSYRLKLPANTILSKGYYYIKCSDTDIVGLYASDKFAFEKFYSINAVGR